MPQAVAAIAIKIAINAAVSLALGFISRALSPKPKAPKLPDIETGRKQVVRSSIEAHQVGYGTAMVSGPLVFAESSGNSNEFLHLVVALAAHEVTGIDSVWLNDVEITNGQLDGSGTVTSGRFANKVRIKKHLGTDSQSADSDLVADVANWTTDHRGLGIAYIYLRFEWDQDVFPTGIPNIKAVVRGRKVWDPRNDPGDPSTRAFSNNAALCQLDYLMSDFGFGVPLAEVNEASWVAAANVCDEDVELAGSPTVTQIRYTCDGSFQVDAKPIAIIEDLLTASAGALVYQQGTFRGYAGAATTASGTLDESDLRGPIEVTPRPSRSERFNAIRGTFIDADDSKAPYTVTDFPPITNATFESQDGGERVFHEIELPFTTNKTRAQRIANLYLQRARQGITVRFPAKLTKLDIATWDVVTVSIARLGWSAKEFRVLEWALAEDGGVDLMLQEEAAAVYTFDPADEIVLDPAPDTNLPDPFNAIVPTGLTLTSGTAALFLKSDGTVVSRIKAAWTASADTFVREYEVQFRPSNESPTPDWQPATPPGNQTNTFIWDVEDGVAYDVRVRAVNTLAVKSSWLTVTGHTVVGKTAVPGDVTGFSAAQNGIVVNFRWDQVADADLAGYEIRYNPNPLSKPFPSGIVWLLATPLTKVTRGTAITSAQVPPGNWTFLIKAFDTSGNESAIQASASATIVADGFDVILQAEQAPGWVSLNAKLLQNLQTWSEEADNSDPFVGWTRTNSTVTVDAIVAPDDTLTADKLVEDGTTNQHVLERTHIIYTGNLDYTLSGFAKPDERKWIGLFFKRKTGAVVGAYFNVEDGTIGTVDSGVTARIKAVDNDFYRCAITADILDGGVISLPTEYRIARADNDDNYVGDSTSGLYVWGMQFGQTSRAGPYNKTEGLAWPLPTPTFVKHYTGVLVPDSQNLASDDNWETFDQFVVNPEPICTYTAAEFDLGFDDTVRIWGDVISELGPGETTGIADPELQIDYQLDAGLLDLYEPWTIGNVKARYVTHRIVLDTSKGVAKITGFKPTIDLAERSEGAKSIAVGAGGLAITYARRFHVPPRITVTIDGATALIATKASVTVTGFTAHVFNTSGTEVGGTIDWIAEGA